jgi:hypothetical protein
MFLIKFPGQRVKLSAIRIGNPTLIAPDVPIPTAWMVNLLANQVTLVLQSNLQITSNVELYYKR